jgi:hypothetical protein
MRKSGSQRPGGISRPRRDQPGAEKSFQALPLAWFAQVFMRSQQARSQGNCEALWARKGTSAVNRKEKFSIDTPTLAMQNSRRTALSQGRFA